MIDVWIAVTLCLVFCLISYYMGGRANQIKAYKQGVEDCSEYISKYIERVIEKEKSDGE